MARGRILWFAEAKRLGKDKIRVSQRKWLDDALQKGLTRENFLVVEWQLEKSDAAV